jgi:D-glycero-beta-D-manno-heptose-7-phosphate kinase
MLDLDSLFASFEGKKIIVLGDVMIDAYTIGQVSRLSPEAPVPVVNLDHSEYRLGGAANVALNLVALGAHPIICSVVGDDSNGHLMTELLQETGLQAEGLVKSQERKTTVKTRIIANRQQLLRIDDEQTNLVTIKEEEELINKVESFIKNGVDAIIFEDYNKGVLSPKVIEQVIALANTSGVITSVDPKKDHFLAYKHVTLFKPNLKELKEGLNTHFDFSSDKKAFENAVSMLEEQINCKVSFVTLSEHGVFIKQRDEKYYINAHLRSIADVSGAGDTVIALATLCLCAGLEVKMIAEIANIAGGLVCEEIGVVSINKDRLKREIQSLLG